MYFVFFSYDVQEQIIYQNLMCYLYTHFNTVLNITAESIFFCLNIVITGDNIIHFTSGHKYSRFRLSDPPIVRLGLR